MPTRLRTLLATAVHAGAGLLVAWFLAHGIDLSPHWSALLEMLAMAAAVAGYSDLTRWLATTKRLGTFGPLLAKVMTLGTGALTATKTDAGDPAVAALAALKADKVARQS